MAQQPTHIEQKSESNVVLVGDSSVMNYVLAVHTQIAVQNQRAVTIRARGVNIVRAIDTQQLLKRKYHPELKLKDVRFNTEEYEKTVEGKPRKFRVSSIEIDLIL